MKDGSIVTLYKNTSSISHCTAVEVYQSSALSGLPGVDLDRDRKFAQKIYLEQRDFSSGLSTMEMIFFHRQLDV